ncbi:hypothetical protein [Leifsonia sp. NPDC077715]|uniref:hypothetical protein n=1 Tax=Leifsonia sp. NPDC077715 TaxID=3155539 RepID=UPI003416E3FD
MPGTRTDYADYDDYVERSSALIGSPQEVLDKLARYHEAFGHTTISIGGHPGLLERGAWTDSLELFRSEVLPAANALIGDPAWPSPVGLPEVVPA